ncbi:MAG: helix-turn-helix transcriptional regulator [Oscillospiraceae bacterium]|nr:helix-turn-helix transcriptional regulator [Oscillospiraceae bacterium]
MAAKKVGDLIREARTNAGLTQAQLAEKADVTASDISKAERGEKELSQAVLKKIAKATGVTQASLLNAPKGASGKTSSGKTGSSGKASGELKLTAAEKKLVELYRAADADTKKAAVSLLKGEKTEGGILGTLFSGAVDTLLGGKK